MQSGGWDQLHANLCCCHFFDDYIVLNQPELARSSELLAGALFKLLGWIFAEDGRKSMPLGNRCKALGVVFDPSPSAQGVCKVANTESRVQEIWYNFSIRSAEVERQNAVCRMANIWPHKYQMHRSVEGVCLQKEI